MPPRSCTYLRQRISLSSISYRYARQCFRFLERSSALNQINDQNNHSNHEYQMDQAAPDMPKKTQKPENDKNYEYSPKHKFIFGLVFPPRIVCSNPTERLKAKS